MTTAAAVTKKRAPREVKTGRPLKRLAGREDRDEAPPAHQVENPNLQVENELEKMPPAIKNGRFAVNFLKPHFDHDAKTDARTVGLELSLELREEHEQVIPKEIKTWWEQVKQGGVKNISLLGVPMQHVELGIAPEADDRDLELEAPIQKVSIAVIEKEGGGHAIEVIRLAFRVMVDLNKDIVERERFACRQFGKVLWCRLQAVQGSLL